MAITGEATRTHGRRGARAFRCRPSRRRPPNNTTATRSTGDLLSAGLLAAGLLLTLARLELLRRRLSRRIAGLAIAGQVALVISILATAVAGHEVLDAVYICGTLAWIAGLIGVAVAAGSRARARVATGLRAAARRPRGLALAYSGGAALLGRV